MSGPVTQAVQPDAEITRNVVAGAITAFLLAVVAYVVKLARTVAGLPARVEALEKRADKSDLSDEAMRSLLESNTNLTSRIDGKVDTLIDLVKSK